MKNLYLLPALFLGLATLIVSRTLPEIPREPGVKSPILELEFVCTPGDVEKVLGPGEEVRRAAIGNVRADRFFLVTYGLFLVSSALGFWYRDRQHWLWLAVVLALFSPVFDILENQQLLAILGSEKGDWPAHLPLLAQFTWMKWLALAGTFLVLGWHCKAKDLFGKVLFGLSALIAVTGFIGLFQASLSLGFAMGVVLLFPILWVWEIVYFIRHRKEIA